MAHSPELSFDGELVETHLNPNQNPRAIVWIVYFEGISVVWLATHCHASLIVIHVSVNRWRRT
ncbi:MAG: hypothetical protein ACHP79_18230 [Terriglobales bacterium]